MVVLACFYVLNPSLLSLCVFDYDWPSLPKIRCDSVFIYFIHVLSLFVQEAWAQVYFYRTKLMIREKSHLVKNAILFSSSTTVVATYSSSFFSKSKLSLFLHFSLQASAKSSWPSFAGAGIQRHPQNSRCSTDPFFDAMIHSACVSRNLLSSKILFLRYLCSCFHPFDMISR